MPEEVDEGVIEVDSLDDEGNPDLADLEKTPMRFFDGERIWVRILRNEGEYKKNKKVCIYKE